MMGDGPPKERGRHRVKVESEMIRRREREFKHQQMWSDTQDYYRRWDKVNNKFDQWTSPRYYEENNKMLSELRLKKDKEELLKKRREKLRKLLEEDERSYAIEWEVKKSLPYRAPPTSNPPTEVLKEINHELKRKEEEKRKREAELKLYHQWRNNNPIVRQMESKYRFKDLKLSWLDQQIEKRIEKENEEKQAKQLVREQEERLRRQQEEEESAKKALDVKRKELKEQLEGQMKAFEEKQKLSEELRRKEEEEAREKTRIEELEEAAREEDKRRLAKETALFNIKQHKLKLKQKALDVQETLSKDQEMIVKMQKLVLEERVQDEQKKRDIQRTLSEFLHIVKEQRELEKQRQKHLDFLFDSEAKAVYDKQLEMWRNEERARKKLLKDVLDTVRKQVDENIDKCKSRQMEVLREREEMLAKIEELDREMEALKRKEEQRKVQRRVTIQEDIKVKNAKKKLEENCRLKEIDEELERVRKEEERLSKEIMEIQRRRAPCKPKSTSTLFC